MELYPLRFQPLFKEYIWGGRRLGTDLNKSIGDSSSYAESWEIVDHDVDQSVVVNGQLAGKTLSHLVKEYSSDLLGEKIAREIADPGRPENLRNRFPLLFKFLDANRNLSVQVHPDDQMGSTLTPPDLGKTEAWFVVGTSPGAKVYVGLKEGVDEQMLVEAIANSTAESVLHCFEPKVGDCIFIPAGTIQWRLGEGLLIAEIQQCSNTTFRLYDWGRVGADGKSRELHIRQGIAATDFSKGPVDAHHSKQIDDQTELIVECEKFKMQKMILDNHKSIAVNKSFKILVVLSGSIGVAGDPSGNSLGVGETMLIPAMMNKIEVDVFERSELLVISG